MLKIGQKLYCTKSITIKVHGHSYIYEKDNYYNIFIINEKGNHVTICSNDYSIYDFYTTDDKYDDSGMFADEYIWDYFCTVSDLRNKY